MQTTVSLAPHIYIGCYKDSWPRDFANKAPFNTVTPARCNSWAAENGYAYFGVQYGSECFGGSKYGSQGKAFNCDVKVRVFASVFRLPSSLSCFLLGISLCVACVYGVRAVQRRCVANMRRWLG